MEIPEEFVLNNETTEAQAQKIAIELISKYPGKILAKRGIKKAYSLPHVKASEIYYLLITNHNFEEFKRNNLRVPSKSL